MIGNSTLHGFVLCCALFSAFCAGAEAGEGQTLPIGSEERKRMMSGGIRWAVLMFIFSVLAAL